ncbi:MAG TPA: glutamate--tRNA ligase [Ignavibacteria bacterium]|nr:glutamate--tRNA ligase [Bacteroidota bacterium]HRE12232.1 glutamate--tRNA ligase [Ignavibacteria bacterium]HRF65014.1 glutamate--tRNA ligase [Ignavibacteria bacterium]HRJ03441.1 glutamate--tRNA ligase [Ignavibacteria bacterium]
MNNEVRVRFAPSPTGYLHLGSLRTALFNYLFARHHNGKFILRIEDTDQSRKVEGAVENLINILNEMGLNYDEGPGVGGEFGPYFQSERLDIYKKYCDELLASGHAYYAFETAEELDEMRKVQQMQGKQTMYDRRARVLTENEVKEKLASGIPYVIRLKVPLDTEIRFTDIIRGNVKIDTNLVDDQVLLKSDGFPTYHLANVIDDHLMQITHIIRGEEWLTSVPKHIILYNAFGWEVPQMAHVPLILNPDKSKLSKRQGDVATEDYLRKGYLKEALLNFMTLLGWNPGDGEEKEIFTKAELIEKFSIERVNSAGAVFNVEKLNWMNGEYIKNYDIDALSELIIPYLNADGIDTSDNIKTKRVIFAIRNYINKLDEASEQAKVYYNEVKLNDEQTAIVKAETSIQVFNALAAKIEAMLEITADNFKPVLSEVQKETGVKGKNLFMPVRLALTGEEHGPELGMIAYVLGKEEVLKRLRAIV